MGHKEQKQNSEPLRAVVYVRISDDPEGTERGVDRQEADCRAYAAAHGWEVVAVFRENDTSAFKQRTITLPSGERVRRVIRPEFRTMLRPELAHLLSAWVRGGGGRRGSSAGLRGWQGRRSGWRR